MRPDMKKSVFISTSAEQIDIIFNDKYKDVSQIELNDEFRLMEYKCKEEYQKPNKNTNIYIAVFTTAYARLKLYSLLEILDRRVLYMDTDSVIYIDDGSDAVISIEEMLGSDLGELTDELKGDHIEEYVGAGPKDYGYETNKGKVVIKNKGIILNAEAEEKITLNKKIELVKSNNTKSETIENTQFKLSKKDNSIKVIKQNKIYDFEFNKRMIVKESEDSIYSLPYGY
jgi:hypothetical protein